MCRRELEHPCSIPTSRVPAGTQPLGAHVQEEEQEQVFGEQAVPCPPFPAWTRYFATQHLLCCGEQMWYPLPAMPSPGYSWQLQHSPAGMCQAGDGCQPRGHHWVHRKAQRGHRRGVSGPWAHSVGSPAPRKAINMPSANGAVMGTQRLIGTGINI